MPDTLQKTYTVFNSRQGGFVINNVMPAGDYIVTVSPEAMYQHYMRRDLTLDAGNAYLDIVLKPFATRGAEWQDRQSAGPAGAGL